MLYKLNCQLDNELLCRQKVCASNITNFLCLCSPLDTTVDSKTPDYEAVTGLYANTTNDSSNAVYSDPSTQTPPPLPPFNPMIPETSPIPVNELGNYVSEKHFGMNAGFKAEFQVWSGVRNTFMSVLFICYACLMYEIFEGTIIFDVPVFYMFLYQTLYTGEEKSCSIGQRDDYKLLNRFKNITVCK